MYLKLNKEEKELYEQLMDITGVDYNLEGNMFPINNFINILKDLKNELEKKDASFEELEEEYKKYRWNEEWS